MCSFRKLRNSNYKKYLQVLFLAFCFVIITYLQFIKHPKAQNEVKILDFKDYTWEKSSLFCRESLPYSDLKKSFVICGTKTDYSIASWFADYIKYEPEFMELIAASLINYQDSMFIDIGSNIGPYSLIARSLGHSVIAVDPIIRNHGQLFNSFVLNDFDKKHSLTQILNAVSDSYTSMDFQQPDKTNPGNVIMKEITDGEINDPDKVIHSVKFEDILDLIPENKTVILKIDIEGYECKALSNFLSTDVKKRYIPYMLVEILNICKDDLLCPGYKDIFLTSLEKSGYIPYVPEKTTYEKLKEACVFNSLFVHETAEPIEIEQIYENY